MTSTKTPSILWAQRSSATNKEKVHFPALSLTDKPNNGQLPLQNLIYLTVSLRGMIQHSLKYTIKETSISLRANAKEGNEQCEYAFELDFYAEVVPKALKECRRPQSVTIVILKKNSTSRYWPQLSKAVLSYVKTDFSRWTWKGDDSDDEDEVVPTMNISAPTTESDELSQGSAPPSVRAHAKPQVLWAQRSSPAEKLKNIIYITVNAQDIAQSTLKCIFTETSMSFHAFAREYVGQYGQPKFTSLKMNLIPAFFREYEEREYAFNLDFHADVIPESVQKHLTKHCLTIILFKKKMDARHWPGLQKAGGVTLDIRTDFKRWTWEGDDSDKIIDASIDSHTPRAKNGQHLWKVDELNRRGIFFLARFERLGEIEDMERAVSCFEDVVQGTPQDDRETPSRLNNLGNSYFSRFERTGDLQDVDRAISHYQQAVESSPSNHAGLPSWSNNLGNSYLRRFERIGDPQDIGLAIFYHQKAVESAPADHADIPSWFNNLGTSFLRRFNRSGDLQDIDQSISHHQKSIESISPDHPDVPTFFNSLGNSYLCRFERTGNIQDIDRAISYTREPLNPLLPVMLTSQRAGDLLDIDRAISHHQKAVESTPADHANLPSWLNNLGSSYMCRFERIGDLKDVDYAITYHQKSLQLTPSGHADLPSWFNNLGNSYSSRFQRTGDQQDIDRAIFHHHKAVESTPSGHADRLVRLNSLGSSYSGRFEHTGDLKDIECAILYHQKAFESAPLGHADLPTFLNSLGNSFSSRFERTGDFQDIKCAISYHQKAIESTSSGRAELPNLFTGLGNSYLGRFESIGDLQDIDNAITHYQNAIGSAPSGHAWFPSMFHNLGNAYSSRFERTHYPPDVHISISSYRQAAEAHGTPSMRLQSAKLAAELSSVHDISHCLVDFSLAIQLLSEVAGLEQTIHRRHVNLHGHSNLVGAAVATALRLNKTDLALEWLEKGRCLVWNQFHQLRTPIDDLRLKSPSLADQLRTVASSLEFYGTHSALSITSSRSTLADDIQLQDDTRNHTLYATQYKQLLAEIRGIPDFQDFLQPPKAATLLSTLPPNGPIITFNFYKHRCDALAVIAGIEGPLHVPLEDFSLMQAERLQKTLQFDLLKQREVEDQDRASRHGLGSRPSMSFVLKDLWCKVVKPILEALKYTLESPPNFSDRRRIWWCPTGPLAFLPLHAAGIYGSACRPGSCISDFVVSSYTPTVRSLNDKFLASSTSSKSTSIVLVSQTDTPGLPSIPSTRKETYAVKAMMKGTSISTLLLDDSHATKDKVKAQMSSCSWVHFACHGVQDVHQPLESGLCLHDGRLELLEIMKQQIPNPHLAFLSACQTSKGDHKLSEEVVHLTAGMLAVGYRGVVGTMWGISDMHGPKFATEFYQY